MRDQLKTLNDNLRRETEQLLSRDRENQLLRDESESQKKRLEDYRGDSSAVKEEQARLIEGLRTQLNEARERIVEMKEEKQREFKKIKERYED